MIRRRGRFHDLVERQLDLFAREHADLLGRCEQGLRAYRRAPRDEAEERYGDYVEHAEAARDALEELRTAYARTLDLDTAIEYEAAFDRLARRRFPRVGLGLE